MRRVESAFSSPWRRSFFVLLAALFPLLAPPALRAQEQKTSIEQASQTLDRARATLDDVKARLADPPVAAATLKDLNARLQPLPDQLQGVVNGLNPKIEAVKARVSELSGQKTAAETVAAPAPGAPPAPAGATAPPSPVAPTPAASKPAAPKLSLGKDYVSSPPPPEPQAAAPASPPDAAAKVQAELAQESKLLEEMEAIVKRARALLVETGQVQLAVLERERSVFKRELFRQTSSLFSPELWRDVGADAPPAFTVARLLAQHSAATFFERLSSAPRGAVVAVGALIMALALAISFVARRVLARGQDSKPTQIQKAAGAAIGALTIIATPLAVIGALAATLSAFDLVDPLARPFMDEALEVAAITALCYGLARAVFAPAYPHWRLIDPGANSAKALTRLVLLVALALAVARLVEAAEVAAGARLSLIVADRGLAAIVVALLLLFSMFRLRGATQEAGERRERTWFALARHAALVIVAIILLSCALGYVTFASFVVFALAWLMMVVVSVRLFQALAAAAIEAGFDPKNRLGQAVADVFGEAPLQPISVLLSGLVTLLCAGVGVIVALAPFGVESDAIFANLRATFYTLNIGDVTISPATIAEALLLFGVVLALAHALRRWLEARFLPLTRLDRGLRSAIGSSVSYLGLFLALAAAGGYLGFGLERLAIIAGALSVGLGFGLQSIVNNLVSGLIILWEGAIRVGDWIVVGEDQGHVKRINVRSTEIETFDRATMIIPNSNLVSGSVKNWVRGDKVGRIKLAISQRATVDPTEVEDILLAAARAQEGVLRIPAPKVMFLAMDLAMEEEAFRFELWCYVEDVEQAARVRSDLHFEIYRRFVAAGLLAPAGGKTMTELAVAE